MQSKFLAFCREPLVHFLAIGAGFFVIWHCFGDRLSSRPERIVINPAQIELLVQVWMKTHLRQPTAEELAGLIEQEIDEEILYREAVALGLDRDDPLIRRRLAVKMEFVTDDLAEAANPSNEKLQAFMLQHPDKFIVEPRTTFVHVFINRSQRGEGATAEADRLLALLSTDPGADWHKLGDSLPVPNEYEAASAADVARIFGRDFPKKLSALRAGHRSGPLESPYGLHLVLVRERTGGRIPALNEVRDEVLNHWLTAQRQKLTADFRRLRREKYAVTVQWPEWADKAATLIAGTEVTKGAR